MKNKGFLTPSFTAVGRAITRKQGTAGNRRLNRQAPATLEPPAAALRTPNCFIPLVSLGVVAMTVQR
jgi:hypothetical protein